MRRRGHGSSAVNARGTPCYKGDRLSQRQWPMQEASGRAQCSGVRTGPPVVLVVITALPCSRTVILFKTASYVACSADRMVEDRLTAGAMPAFAATLKVNEPPGGSAKPVGVYPTRVRV